MLFLTGFTECNVTNLLLVTLFLIYFATLNTTVLVKVFNRKKKDYEYRDVDFMQRYWVVEIAVVEFIMAVRYIFYFYYVNAKSETLTDLF
jgi:hypothetical protein